MKINLRSFRQIIWLPIIAILFFASCKKDNDLDTRKEIYAEANHAIHYQSIGSNIQFTIDVISDEDNELVGTWPLIDFCYIYVDRNSNTVLDPGVDLLFNPRNNGTVCVATLMSQSSTSACAYYPDVTASSLFSATENSATPHVNYTVNIPKSTLSTGNTANIVIHIHSSKKGWEYFPSNSSLFNSHYKISW